MKEELKEIALRLKPPPHDASPEKVQAWRWFVALVAGANAMGLLVHVLLSCGFAASIGISGFAKASDISDLKQQFASVKVDLQNKRVKELSSLLLDTKQKQCMASGQVKLLYLQTYNDLRSEYFTLMQREFPDPPCSDFN